MSCGENLFYHMDGPTGNGVITWDEFKPMINKIGWNDQQALGMWYQVDQDRSGSLDKGEFLRFCNNPSVAPYIRKQEASLGPPPPRVGEKAFAHIDGSGIGVSDGKIAWTEFLPLILKIGWNQQTAMQMWYVQDDDRSGFLSREEFITFCNRPDVRPYIAKCEATLPDITPGGFGPPGGGGGFGAPGGGGGGGAPVTSTQMSAPMTTEEKSSQSYNEKCERDIDGDVVTAAANGLRKAMKGFGTNEKAINKIIGPMSNAEIQAVRSDFKNRIGRDLIKDFKSETSGNYENLLVALTMAPAEYDAFLVRKACKGMGTNEGLLSEVLATRTPEEVTAMQKAYKDLYKKDMITVIESETSGNLEKIYCTLLKNQRTMGSDVAGDVEKLYKAGEKKFGTDEGVFIRILGGYRREYVEKLYWAYAEKHGKALDRVVRSEFSGNLKKVLEMLCTPIEIQWSKALKEAMKGMGTNDNDLVRLICSMKERSLRKIAKRFLQDQSKTLAKWVDGETSGDYGKLMTSVCQNWGNIS